MIRAIRLKGSRSIERLRDSCPMLKTVICGVPRSIGATIVRRPYVGGRESLKMEKRRFKRHEQKKIKNGYITCRSLGLAKEDAKQQAPDMYKKIISTDAW